MIAAAAATAPAPRARPRLLVVDDEPAVLEALALNLRRAFEVSTATSGELAIAQLRAHDDFAVVVSDMRMPRMDGAAFLARAREISPNTVRILLTGHADLDATTQAVNQGQIFRFLTKPCPRDTLRSAIDSAVAQYRRISAERLLLEQPLQGILKVLVDVFAVTRPASFSRANEIKTRVIQLAHLLGIADAWQLAIAAIASQLSAVVLPQELSDKLERKLPLTEDEQHLVDGAPAKTELLLANIPRRELVFAMLALHVNPPVRQASGDPDTHLIEFGAHVLRIAIDLQEIESARTDHATAPIDLLREAARQRTAPCDPEVLEAVERMYGSHEDDAPIKTVAARALVVGMVLAEDVWFHTGNLMVARGYEVTESFIARINQLPAGSFAGVFRVIAPC